MMNAAANIGLRLGVAAVAALLAISDLRASGISGDIEDPSGAPIAGAQVSAVNLTTGARRKTVSNESGFYTIPFLPPGPYRLVVRREGFMAATYADIRLVVDQQMRLSVGMSVARVNEIINVKAGLFDEHASAELSTVLGEKTIRSLPLNGQNFTQLLALAPGLLPVSTAQGSRIGVGDAAVTGIPDTDYLKPSFNGQQNRSQIVFVDGIIDTDFRSNSYAVLPNIDLIQEFKVQTHNDKVEWGGVTGGIINLISKSGTNTFHGSGHWFVRNDAFDARDPFKDATRRSPAPFRQNQFGATLGGPLVRNSTFFSVGLDGWRYRKPSQTFSRLPTNAELDGDFSQSVIGQKIYNPFTTRTDESGNLVRDPFPGNVIPPSLISPLVKGFFQIYEERPNLAGSVFNYVNSVSARDDANSVQVKIDRQFSDRDTFFLRWSRQLRSSKTPSGEKKFVDTDMTADNYGGGWMHVFRPSVVINLRGGVARRDFLENLQTHTAGITPMNRLGITNAIRFGGLLMSLTAPWGTDIGLRGPARRQNPTFSSAGDLTVVHGSHSFKTGFQWIGVDRLQVNKYQRYYFSDDVTDDPRQPGATGASLASALLGLPAQFEGFLPDLGAVNFGIGTWSGYLQDEWRAGRNLTLNFGLRFDHNRSPHLRTGFEAGPDIDRGLWLIGASRLPAPCNEAGKAPCIPGNGLADVPHGDKIALAGAPNYIPKEIWDNWGPRVGVAYRLGERTILRAGYGLYWDTLNSNSQYTQHNLEGRWPATFGFSGVANQNGELPRSIENLQPRFESALPEASPWNYQGWANDPNRKDGYSQQWNVELQRQVAGDLVVSAAYVGSVNGRLEYSGLGNSARTPGPGSPEEVDQRRPVPYLGGGVLYSRSIGRASYNALQWKLRRRFRDGLGTMLAYTWSKAIDTGSSGWFGVENGPGGSSANQNYYSLQADRSVSSYNIPHYLSWYAVYELPAGRGKRWLASGAPAAIFGKWKLNSILQWRSGQPYNLSVAGDVANIGDGRPGWLYARPDLVGDPRVTNPTVDQYFNTAAFAIPQYQYGNFGRNVLTSDSVFRLDLALEKSIAFDRDSAKNLTLRLEAFNALNHIDWAPPGTIIGKPDAGKVSAAAAPPRVLQFGLRLSF